MHVRRPFARRLFACRQFIYRPFACHLFASCQQSCFFKRIACDGACYVLYSPPMWRKLNIGLMALSLLLAASVAEWVKPVEAQSSVEKTAQAPEDQPVQEVKALQYLPQQQGPVALRVLLPAMPIWSVFAGEDREQEVPRSMMPDALIDVHQLLFTHIIPSLAP